MKMKMKMTEYMQEIRRLALSDWISWIIHQDLLILKDTDIEKYERFSTKLEKEGFESGLELLLYVINNTLEMFHKIENSDEEFSLPTDNKYAQFLKDRNIELKEITQAALQ